MKVKRGFTLIELLVVVAIIGLLATVVLAFLGNARQKGADTSIEGQLNSARQQAEIYANAQAAPNYGSGGALCTATQANNGLAGILSSAASSIGASVQATPGTVGVGNHDATHLYCYSTQTAWVVEAPLYTPGAYWCVDSLGTAKQTTTNMIAQSQQTNCNP